MPSQLSRRLSAQDAAFLYFERRNAPLHIGSIGIFEGEIPFERFVAHMASRLPLIPRYRQRLAFLPFSLAHPTWEDDPAFDIRNHVRHVPLARPGNDRQLAELTTQLFAPQLDRDKPLWETYLITGLEGDRSAIVSKVHHCLVDGVSGIELLMAIVDLTPEPAPAPDAPPWQPKPFPSLAPRLSDALFDYVEQQREVMREFIEAFVDPSRPVERSQSALRTLRQTAPWLANAAPRTPFAVPLSRERNVAFNEMSFVEIREIRTSLGGTVNDVVLAVLAGALRRYLSHHGHKVEGVDLRVACPVNVRMEEEQGALGNRVSMMLAALPLGVADPAERLKVVRERIDSLKQSHQAAGLELLTRLVSRVPAPFHALAGAVPAPNTVVNMICTNVPGPMIPLYSVGHLMLSHHPLVPLSLGMGLGIGVTSYNQRLYFGLMAEPRAVPDIDFLKRCVDESFLELRAAAGVPATDIPTLKGLTGNGPAKPEKVTAAKTAD